LIITKKRSNEFSQVKKSRFYSTFRDVFIIFP